MDLRLHIRDVPDFPSPGILFRDITPMLQHPSAFQFAVDQMAERFADTSFDAIVGIESRGFLFAAPLSYKLGIPLVPARKQGKLPFITNSVSYELEYGSDAIEYTWMRFSRSSDADRRRPHRDRWDVGRHR